MNPIRKKRLIIVLFLVFGVAAAVGLALVALQQNINLFFSPTQIAEGEAPVGQRIRGGGLVVTGSVDRDSQSLMVRFDITDGAESVPVEYVGILPDLFREGQGIVAQGSMRADGVFEAVEVLAKHDENYMPPEVQEAIDKAGHPAKSTES
ncbi:cytochrome c maturation protein CcmE [Aestuariirhabdus sp. LZHN29]|uniref:cytochrome c maturation protein CcmE n=1 Tax=Aestuariirhabdus sp. LZHN29 TaxID=3417462 RepID=UPI003CEE9F37